LISDDFSPTAGAQSVRRSLELLRVLGEHQQDGVTLTEAMHFLNLTRSTTHRLLNTLAEEGFAERDLATKRYRLGIDAMQLGAATRRRLPLVSSFLPLMKRLARVSGDTVFLVVREGDEVVCLHREEGPHPIKVFTLDQGSRRIIGIGAGGLALLAALTDEEIDAIYKRYAAEFDKVRIDHATLWRDVRSVRAQGFSRITDRTTQGVSAVGAVVPGNRKIQLAMSLATVNARLPAARATELGRLLRDSLSEATGVHVPGRTPRNRRRDGERQPAAWEAPSARGAA